MNFKQIQKQVAKQQRSKPGLVDVGVGKGYNLNATGVYKTALLEGQTYEWTKLYYIFDRSQPDASNVRFFNAIPVVDIASYASSFPERQFGYHYFDFWNQIKYGEEFTRLNIKSDNKGSITDVQLLNQMNVAYGIKIFGVGYKQTISLAFQSNGANICIMAKELTKGDYLDSTLTYTWHVLYSSDINGLDGWNRVDVPVGSDSTNLYVLAYVDQGFDSDHDEFITEKPRSSAILEEKINKNTLTTQATRISLSDSRDGNSEYRYTQYFINLKVDLSKRIGDPPPVYPNPFDKVAPPSWSDSDIACSADPITGNVINTLTFDSPSDIGWDSISVFRRTYTSDITQNHIDNKNFYNLIQLDTSGYSTFSIGGKIHIDDITYSIKNVFTGYANKIYNSDFVSWGSGEPQHWDLGATATGSIEDTANIMYATCYYGDYRFNGCCLKMVSEVTDTTKSYYVETEDYLYVDTSDYLSFWMKLDSGIPTHALKILYYSSSDGTPYSSASIPAVDLSSAVYERLRNFSYSINSTSTGRYSTNWNHIYGQFNADKIYASSTDSKFVLLSDVKCIKVRFYSSYQDTSHSSYLLDGFHVGSYGYDYVYNNTSTTKSVLQLNSFFEKPHNEFTKFHTYFEDTSYGSTGEMCASTVNGLPQYVDSSDWKYCVKFDYGIKIVDSATNYLANGDFMGGGHYWDSAEGFSWELEEDTVTPYSSCFARLYGTATAYAYIEQSSSKSGLAGDNTICLSLWAKSPVDSQKIKLYLADERGHVSSATYQIGNIWDCYQYSSTFSSGGDTVTARLIVENQKGYWEVDVAGIQLEDKPTISDFNKDDTSQGSFRDAQGLEYSSSGTIIPQDCGTVKLWYIPTMDNNGVREQCNVATSGVFNGIFFTGDSDTYKSIYWDYWGQKFVLRQKSGSDYYECFVSTPNGFATCQSIHIVATWDENGSKLYVNNKASTSDCHNVDSVSGQSFSIGCNSPNIDSSFSANGIISSFRIDKSKWSHNDVGIDFISNRKLFSSDVNSQTTTEKFIGSKTVSGNEASLSFTDDVGLEYNKAYTYVFRVVDKFGNVSSFSEEKTVNTKRIPYEFQNRNLIPNSSFEIQDTASPKYWRRFGSPTYVTSDYFVGTRSAYISTITHGMLTDYLAFDTSISHYISYYAKSGAPSMYFYLYNGRMELQAFRVFSPSDMSSSNSLGLDSDYWTRYHTSIGKTNITDASVDASKYIRIGIVKGLGDNFYVDAVQLEKGSLSAYREGFIVESGNMGTGNISGTMIQYDTLIGQHFLSGDILVSNSTVDANRIVIGSEKYSESFSELTPSYFRWHSPNTSTSSGWNYTKHIESGIANFGEQVSFAQRYYNWGGSSVNPMLIITPYNITTFSTAGTTSTPQSLRILTSASPGGFNVIGQLYQGEDSYTQQYITGLSSAGGSTETIQTLSEGNFPSEGYSTDSAWGCTVLPTLSTGNSGTINYYLSVICAQKTSKPRAVTSYDNSSMVMYGTTESIRSEPNSTWFILKDILIDPSNTYSGYQTENINNPNLCGCKSIGFKVFNNGYNYQYDVSIDINPNYLYYQTGGENILLEGSALGSFYWMSIDGGNIG